MIMRGSPQENEMLVWFLPSPQTPGMTRAEAIFLARVGAQPGSTFPTGQTSRSILTVSKWVPKKRTAAALLALLGN
jgi:hypothetical protein